MTSLFVLCLTVVLCVAFLLASCALAIAAPQKHSSHVATPVRPTHFDPDFVPRSHIPLVLRNEELKAEGLKQSALLAAREFMEAAIESASNERDALRHAAAAVALAANITFGRALDPKQLEEVSTYAYGSSPCGPIVLVPFRNAAAEAIAVAAIALHLSHLHFHHNVDSAMCVRVVMATRSMARSSMSAARSLYELLNVSADHNLDSFCPHPRSAVTYGTIDSHLIASAASALYLQKSCTIIIVSIIILLIVFKSGSKFSRAARIWIMQDFRAPKLSMQG